MDLHAFTKSLLWLNLASKLSLEDMIWKTWSCWGFEATLAHFSLFSPSSSAFWFVCFLSQIALSSPGPSELETAYLLLCSVCCWPEAPINFKGHKMPGSRKPGAGRTDPGILVIPSRMADFRERSGGCVEYEALLSALHFPPFFSVQRLSFHPHTLPAHYKAPSGLQNPSMSWLVRVRFLFLAFPNVLLSLCATS